MGGCQSAGVVAQFPSHPWWPKRYLETTVVDPELHTASVTAATRGVILQQRYLKGTTQRSVLWCHLPSWSLFSRDSARHGQNSHEPWGMETAIYSWLSLFQPRFSPPWAEFSRAMGYGDHHIFILYPFSAKIQPAMVRIVTSHGVWKLLRQWLTRTPTMESRLDPHGARRL